MMTPNDRRLEVVHLVRHAHAGDPGRWDGPDERRPLTMKGRQQAERLGAFLVRASIQPDRVISSPKLRAIQTAEPIAAAFGLDVFVDARLASNCDLERLDTILAEAGVRAPLLVGHDPDFSDLLTGLIGSSPLEMRKGALATIEVRRPLRIGAGLLRWLVPPELLVDPDP